jgi:hypothetical protein
MRKLADVNPGQVRRGLLQVASLAGLMQVVPAHDVRADDGIPRLPARPRRPRRRPGRLRREGVTLIPEPILAGVTL